MPIKLPKGFQRRKSSGNVLDDAVAQSESSFRVLPRPGSSGAPLDLAPPRPFQDAQYRNSFEEDSEELFSVARPDAANRYGSHGLHYTEIQADRGSGSGGTNNSLSTAPYDSAASSRMSTSSTNPSSVDTKSDKNVKGNTAAAHGDVSVPPTPTSKGGFLRNRNFSIGRPRKSHEVNDLPPLPSSTSQKTPASSVRDRSMTVSSVTTATPPRLDDSSLGISTSGADGFEHMFDGIGAKPSRDASPTRTSQYQSGVATGQLRPAALRSNRAGAPHPISINHTDQIESSPYSWTSQDALMRSPSPSKTVTQSSPQFSSVRNVGGPVSGSFLSRQESSEDDNLFEDTPLHRTKSPSVRSPPSSFPTDAMRARGYSQATSTIRNPISERSSLEASGFDSTLFANAELASRYGNVRVTSPKAANTTGKVMTPAQFERYKQQKEETRHYNKVFGKAESDESGDDYEDDEEDEQEKEREKSASKQRKKQEAHLAVYRQQMMKVTGDRPASTDADRPGSSASNPQARNSSTLDIPAINNRVSQLTVDGKRSSSGGKSSQGDEEEDEDVPLGILAAHGFPNRNRPPSKLMGTSSNPNLRASAMHQASGEAGNRESRLPAFARHLPPDPYFGAGLVQAPHRESLGMHAMPNYSTPNLVMQQAPGAATAHPLHPAGLVGVIAGEERARAMRRGSPNAGPGYELPQMGGSHPGMQRAQTMGNMSGMGMPGMMPGMPGMMSPGDQAQLQMSQQMTQMMQMQMQWMQYMSQQMGQPGHGQMTPEMMSQAMAQQMGVPPPANRPQSVPLQAYPGPGQQQRTMSMLSPSMANWTQSSPAVPQLSQAGNTQYAPSIAPSERSNIGMASRYRPVSTIQPEPEPQWQKRSSTFTSSTLRPFSHYGGGPPKQPQPTVRAVSTIHDDEDDDEQGWAEMAAKKERKKRSWKLRKTHTDTTLQELYNAPA